MFSAAGLDKTLLPNCMTLELFEALQILRLACKNGTLSARQEAEMYAQILESMDAELAAEDWDFI